jgi:hypothetical protein
MLKYLPQDISDGKRPVLYSKTLPIFIQPKIKCQVHLRVISQNVFSSSSITDNEAIENLYKNK